MSARSGAKTDEEKIMEPVLMCVLGLATHFIKAMMQSKLSGGPVTPIGYWQHNPYQSALCLIGAITGFVALQETGNLTLITAYSVGYMANSVADVIGGRAKGKL